MLTYLNGQMLDDSQAHVSTQDAGFQHAVGLFETMFAHNGKVFRLDRHLARLKRSAAELGLAAALHVSEIAGTLWRALMWDMIARLAMALFSQTTQP